MKEGRGPPRRAGRLRPAYSVYQRHDWATEKRAALDAWAAHVLSVVEGRTAIPNVVTLVRAG
jgi:hypothetical protein